METLHIYNSLTRQKEPFKSIIPGHVGMYICGPTVSGESHLGHARPYITFDVVYRYLTHLGNKVRYVRNITDAGHFEEEGRDAVDKISTKAILEKLEPMELVHKYTNLFHWGMQKFNTITPTIEPTATGHIVEQIEMIEDIIAKGYAYEINGSVYFDVNKYHTDFSSKDMPYGILSRRVLEDMLETTRDLDGQDEKRSKVDFALWKNAAPEHIMRWKSPWGIGFPGWHIECSAMSKKYLGDQFDIHGGGMDLQFPHHECEIAQSSVAHNCMMANYWMHNNMITVNGKKMGKSYNNFITLTEMFNGNHPLLTQAYHPIVIRFAILQTHYRSTLDFSNDGLQSSEKGLRRLLEAYKNLEKLPAHNSPASNTQLDEQVNQLVTEFALFMNDDFSVAKIIANMFELVPIINSLKDGLQPITSLAGSTLERLKQQMKVYIFDLLGLVDIMDDGVNEKFKEVMQVLIELRKEAKANKDFVTSDAIRNKLSNLGIALKDEKTGEMTWTVS
jgi:cysteinyl-tRNA synthetase